ncbi:MAG: fused isobutyryl-CoA mutase/GTPase IcmF [Nitriliruptoraceae bacterium]
MGHGQTEPVRGGAPTAARPRHPVRFVTAASLFDGHDAAINIMRRILQSQGAEVVHLGHDRSVADVVTAAIQEDVQGVAISSYQGGHVEYFSYLVEQLRARGAGEVRVFGGGGGVIVPEEIALLEERGVTRIYSPADGQRLGLTGMIAEMIAACEVTLPVAGLSAEAVLAGEEVALARAVTAVEQGRLAPDLLAHLRAVAAERSVPVLGITGTGGAGKSSLTDELIRRLRRDRGDGLSLAVLAIDPSRHRGGGALLGDRIRMNTIEAGRVTFRSMATRHADGHLPPVLDDVIAVLKAAGHDLVIVETPGIGQGDAAIAAHVDVPLYVMTPEFGAASQLEKIAMLEVAEVVAINKFERRGAEDARRDVARQLVRNREAFGADWEDMPVFGTSAARFDDDGVTALYQELVRRLVPRGFPPGPGTLPAVHTRVSTRLDGVLPPGRERYLAEIADTVRAYHARTEEQADLVARVHALEVARDELAPTAPLEATRRDELAPTAPLEATRHDELAPTAPLEARRDELAEGIAPEVRALLGEWERLREAHAGEELTTSSGGRAVRTPLTRRTLAGTPLRRVALPRTREPGELVRFLRREHLPGHFPYTAGVFPFKRDEESPMRMFAGEGDPARTNRRFHYLAAGSEATRLSTAFDSVTLYGRDPSERPDVYGKVGTSGVSVATLDDMKVLYDGFDLCDPTTSVSMTINGPAPAILAMFLNTAIDQQLSRFRAEHGREPDTTEAAALRARTLATVRGTVQADILKEDQGQNTCIFSTEFALRCMADVQEWFIEQGVRRFYSVSISGYHIAEAGANPITQLAFTLANGFTYVEAYLARGMAIDDVAPNLSFFFSNGMDAEYTVLGRVARRIWAIAMREHYGADDRSAKLKYHIQTSGRSLHAQEMDFNDIRTTLQALCAVYDNTNSLHTNAYDEAVTTPTEASVRRALAIQLIIDQEWGLARNENPLQGAFIVEELTDLVEAAVLAEFDRLSDRGGVLGAMETGYQRGRIQDESLHYEQRKHDGTLPIIGVNTFLPDERAAPATTGPELARATEEEKRSQLARLRAFQAAHADQAERWLAELQRVTTAGGNVFAVLMEAVRHCSLGQLTDALFEVGGQYRRNV